MKEKLRNIFLDLSNKKLTEQEALEKIKAVKLANQSHNHSLFAKPVWVTADEPTVSKNAEQDYAQHHVLFIQSSEAPLKELEQLLPASKCVQIQISHKNILDNFNEAAGACFEYVKELLNHKPSGRILVQIVIGKIPDKQIYSALSALLRTAFLENPDLIGQIILSDKVNTVKELAQKLILERNQSVDTIIKFQNNVRSVLVLEEIKNDQKEPFNIFKEKGVYLITGGLGGLGTLFAREVLKEVPEATVIVTGRSKLNSEKQAIINKIAVKSTHIRYVQLDVTDEQAVHNCIKNIIKEHKYLNGIIHAAGVNLDNFIVKKNSAEFKKVIEPKVAGAYYLDQASKHLDLDFFALFSSFASWFGNPGQSDYATANNFMDQFAVYRDELVTAGHRKGKTISINWPLWKEGGMIIANEIRNQLQEATGITPLESSTGIRFFYHCMNFTNSIVLAVKGDVNKMGKTLFPNRVNELSEDVLNMSEQPEIQLSGVDFDDKSLLKKTKEYLRQEISVVLKLPAHRIETKAALEKYGIDSIVAMNLTSQLEKTFGKLSKTLFFEYQNIDDLSEFFVGKYKESLLGLFTSSENQATITQPKASGEPLTSQHKKRNSFIKKRKIKNQDTPAFDTGFDQGNTNENEPIAIIGLSGRYPESHNITEFWKNLRDGKDCIIEVPEERWDWREYYSEDRTEPGRHYSKWGGFIEGVDEFDPRFFNISPREARNIDPQERLFLQHAWMAVEDAGYTRESLQVPADKDLSGQVGVYVGVMYGEYNLSGSLASIANRVSYVLNLHGPSITMDTMCSSSLTSIHLACQDLKSGRTSLGIAGGVNVSIDPNKYHMLSSGQFISSDGHCQSFGEGGDGYIPGEGVGVVLLKRLSEAEKGGDHIYGIIKGSALNHGGKTNGYSVPNPQAQASVISRALRESKTDPRHVSYVEAHGTGTKLGDPIEITSLNKAFAQSRENHFCLLGSAKSNIGHCESAAGIAGITKILLQLKYQQVVPSLHSKRLNPHIDFENTPFIVNQTLRKWENPVINGKKIPRIAGISSFGAGGSNAHIIVQEYSQISQPIDNTQPVAIILSARTSAQLKTKAQDLIDFIEESNNSKQNISLQSLAYTLQVGREAMEERIAFTVTSVSGISEVLFSYLNNTSGKNFYHGQVKQHKDAVYSFSSEPGFEDILADWIQGKNYTDLLAWWVKGLDLDWSSLYSANHPKKMSLPTYPFAKERYWLDATERGRTVSSVTGKILHPLLHSNTSDLEQVSYSSVFSGQEPFIKDYTFGKNGHAVKGLPWTAGIEIARESVEKALPLKANSGDVLVLQQLQFGSLIELQQELSIGIALFADRKGAVAYEIYNKDKEETIYCQGKAIYLKSELPEKLDLIRLRNTNSAKTFTGEAFYAYLSNNKLQHGAYYQGINSVSMGESQLLAHLSLSLEAENNSEGCQLHPAILESGLQAASALLTDLKNYPAELILPFLIKEVRIFSNSVSEMYVWVRFNGNQPPESETPELSIDFCDPQGNICISMEGVAYRNHTVETTTTNFAIDEESVSISKDSISETYSYPKEIFFTVNDIEKTVLDTQAIASSVKGKLQKPTGITLPSPDSVVSGSIENSVPGKIQITLSMHQYDSGKPSGSSKASSVRLFNEGEGIYRIKSGTAGSSNELSAALVAELSGALEAASSEASLKVLIIEGNGQHFLEGGREAINTSLRYKFYKQLINFPYPVIAVMQGNAIGAGFLAASICDFMIASEEGSYGYNLTGLGLYPTREEKAFFDERFGTNLSNEFLQFRPEKNEGYSGAELKARGWTFPIVSRSEVTTFADDLARNLTEKSQTALRLLKQHLARHLQAKVSQLLEVSASVQKPKLSPINVKETLPSFSSVSLNSTGGVLVLQILVSEKEQYIKQLVKELETIVGNLNKVGSHAPVILSSAYPEFLPQHASPEDVVFLTKLLLSCEFPLIAVLDSGANGKGWLISQYCDTVFYSDKGMYSASHLLETEELSRNAAMIFSYRYGGHVSKELLLLGETYTGSSLKDRIGNLQTAPGSDIMERAKELATTWSKLPADYVLRWKRENRQYLEEKLQELPEWIASGDEHDINNGEPGPVALVSEVVKAILHPRGILEVRLEDREARNMFTDDFIAGVTEVFDHIANNAAYKVIVLTGYDNYFASGGTKEGLLAIQEGKSKFTDTKIYQMAMECRVPVIAAMQGHAIGAGWCLGMFADFVLFGKERRYVSPYMNYGFTPGAGATFIFQNTIGYDLARETMMTANEFAGIAFKNRGVHLPVLDKDEVLTTAMELAGKLAELPRGILTATKYLFTKNLLEDAAETYKLELAMHEKTFVKDQETLKQIKKNFIHETTKQNLESKQKEEFQEKRPEAPASGEEILSDLIENIRIFLADELQMKENEIDEDAQFVDLGLDSITGVTWIRKINDKYKTSIEATQIYNYPTLTQLGTHIKEEMEKLGLIADNSEVSSPEPFQTDQKPPKPAPENKFSPTHLKNSVSWFNEVKLTSLRKKLSFKSEEKTSNYKVQPIAVVGIAGQFPEAKDTEEFWNNIANGKNCIKEVPKERWDINEYYQEGTPSPGKTNSKWLGCLDGYDQFDPLFFTISPIEAESMDPQQRLFLQACWHGIEDAGYDPYSLSGSKCGVFVGCTSGDYQLLSREQQLSAQGFTGGTSSILAARISYVLNLQGPCLAIDTACSSSLVAIANACDSLLSGASDLALAGGVYVMTGPEMHVKTAQSGMLSEDGKCYTFDQRANGFVPGEAVGVVMLKRLEDAEKDNDRIYGVIEGWGVNQDGRTNGITAPNSLSQTSLEQDVYDKFEINPEHIQLIEAHGTGTKLGDPIEVNALKNSFKKYTAKNEFCALGSVKSNIGHCLTAAGIAGFIKVLMALKNQKLPPTINYDQLNEHISLNDSPFFVNNRLQDWKVNPGTARRAAVSGFGFSGTNAHLVVGEHTVSNTIKEPVTVITQNGKYIVPLSARNTEQLKEMAINLIRFIDKNKETINLEELSYTYQAGRAAMEERLGLMVSSIEELASKLREFTDGNERLKDVYQGQVKQYKEGLKLISQDKEMKEIIIKKWISDKKLNKVLELWVKGLDFDWSSLYGSNKPQRLSLPLYPFAKERYWIAKEENEVTVSSTKQTEAKLHPLLHKNTASLLEQGYDASSFGKELTLNTNEHSGKKGKIKRISLPTYPFTRERCWPENNPYLKKKVKKLEASSQNLDSIEDILNQIEGDQIASDQAVGLLKDLI
jgi:acyl transferase domain-containing protein/acyl carrier protein